MDEAKRGQDQSIDVASGSVQILERSLTTCLDVALEIYP
jgi:hypothetical protein